LIVVNSPEEKEFQILGKTRSLDLVLWTVPKIWNFFSDWDTEFKHRL